MKISKRILIWVIATSMVAFVPKGSQALYIYNYDANGNLIPAPPDDGAPGGKVEGFKLSLKVDKAKYSTGAPVSLTITFKNLERDGVETPIVHGAWYKLEVLRPDGTIASLTDAGKKAKESAGLFPDARGGPASPGVKIEEKYNLVHRDFDMTQTGEYSLRVSVQVPSVDDPEKKVTLHSNMIKIQID
jgi:hypothetical protein